MASQPPFLLRLTWRPIYSKIKTGASRRLKKLIEKTLALEKKI
jgi:hypothetical protein